MYCRIFFLRGGGGGGESQPALSWVSNSSVLSSSNAPLSFIIKRFSSCTLYCQTLAASVRLSQLQASILAWILMKSLKSTICLNVQRNAKLKTIAS